MIGDGWLVRERMSVRVGLVLGVGVGLGLGLALGLVRVRVRVTNQAKFVPGKRCFATQTG